MPSSVLLALVVAAGVLVLMPALAHRYDTALRGQDELRASPMRVLPRDRRRRTVPIAGSLRPPASPLIVPAAARAEQGVPPSGRQHERGAVLVTQPAPRTRVRVRRGAVGAQPDGAMPIPVSAMPIPVSALPISGPAVSRPAGVASATGLTPVVPVVTPRRGVEVLRARRRRLVLLLALLVGVQLVAGLLAGPAFLLGAVTSALAAVALLTRLRVAAVRRERRQAQERHAKALVARARQHRAEAFVRRALRQVPAGVDREAWLGADAVSQAAAWLASARAGRARPARDVVRVLAAAGREVYPAADGTWAVRPVVRPAARTRTAAGATTAARRAARAADAALPRVVNG